MSHPPEMLQVRSTGNANGNGHSNGHGHGHGSANGGKHHDHSHSAHHADSSASPPTISESRDIPSHTNATKSQQGVPDTPLLLPKFKKNQRQIDHHNHSNCCDKTPPGRFQPSADPGVACKNAIGLHGFAAINVGTRDHMEDRHRIVYGRPDGLFRGFFGVFGTKQHH